MLEIQLQRQLLHICHPFFRSTLFSSTTQLSLGLKQLSTLHVLINNNNHLSVLFRPLVSCVKDENFQSTFAFYQVVLKSAIRVLQCIYKFHFMRSLFEENFIQTLLIQPNMYSLFRSDNKSELDTPFHIKEFAFIC